MTKMILAGAILLTLATLAQAAEPAKADAKNTSATYAITGLHCAPCTNVVETSLKKVPGIASIKVDWNTKNAKVEFNEAVVPAERVAQLIAATPHMMGASLHYDGWLVLKTPELKDEATAKNAKETLSKIAGVKSVATFVPQHMVEVQFASEGKVTTGQLIDALTATGIKAENF